MASLARAASALLLSGLLALLLLPGPGAVPAWAPRAGAVAGLAAPPSPATLTAAAGIAAAAAPSVANGLLRLPDGNTVPTLNGVLEPAPFAWPPERPYSPIAGTETDPEGVEWYVHADGSRSTTRLVVHGQLGRLDPVTSIYNPTDPVPAHRPH